MEVIQRVVWRGLGELQHVLFEAFGWRQKQTPGCSRNLMICRRRSSTTKLSVSVETNRNGEELGRRSGTTCLQTVGLQDGLSPALGGSTIIHEVENRRSLILGLMK